MEQTAPTLLALQPTHLFYMKLYSSNIDREYSVSFYIRVRHRKDGHHHEEYCATVVMYREIWTQRLKKTKESALDMCHGGTAIPVLEITWAHSIHKSIPYESNAECAEK